MNRIDPRTLGANCGECPFAKNAEPCKPVLGYGAHHVHARGVLIGEGPGHDESEVGRPFVGNTGKQLDEVLFSVGIARSDLFTINAMACQPPPGGKNESNLAAASKACFPAFQKQLEPYLEKKTPMFAAGKWAWRAIAALDGKATLPKGGLGKGRGFLRQTSNSTWYIATWHPTYAFFHNPYEWAAFEIDLARFSRLMNGTLRDKPFRLEIRPTVDDILSVHQGPYVSVDVETAPESPDMSWTGKDPTRAKLKVVGLGNENWGLSFHWGNGNGKLMEAFQKVVLARTTVWMNGAWFDHRTLRRYGVRIGRWEDIRDARKALVTTSSPALAYQASLYDDAIPWKESEEDDDKGIVFTEDLDELMEYNAQDNVEQMRVWAGLTREEAWNTPRVQRIYQLRKKMAVISARMHTRGIYLDQKKRHGLDLGLKKLREVRQIKLRALVNIPAFKGGPDDMRALLFKKHATKEVYRFNLDDPIQDEFYTDTGQCSVDQGSLLNLVVNPLVPDDAKKIIYAYWQCEAPQKARSTFVSSELVDQAIGRDGRLRPGWNSGAADTMRWSCSKPNVMTLSKEKD